MDVVGSDGDEIGAISEINADYLVVKKGVLFPDDYYIPNQAVASVAEDKVHLNVTKDQAMNQNPSWSEPPVATTAQSAGYVDNTAAMSSTDAVGSDDDTLVGMDRGSGDLKSDPTPFEHEQDSSKTHVNEDDNVLIPISEEELVATKRTVDRGHVSVERNIVSEEQTLEVPVTEERIHVERLTVDRPVAEGDDAFSGETIEVPVRGQDVDVQKTAHVVEEIEIVKEKVHDTKHVTDTVRREEVIVDDSQANNQTNTGSRDDEGLLDKSQDIVEDRNKMGTSRS